MRTIKENTEALKVAGKETELEVNADKTKYMVMSRDQNAGQSSSSSSSSSSALQLFMSFGLLNYFFPLCRTKLQYEN